MNLRDLKYIVAVAETRHFGKAAERCFVNQPTLSGQIRKLEDELGITIFERTNRSVEVTPAGSAILEHARLMLEQADAIQQLARAYQDPLAGPLRIGAIPTLSPYLIPLILAPLRQQHPQIKPVLSEDLTATLLERLRHHEIDAALLATPVEEQDFVSLALFDEPFWIAYPSSHRTVCPRRGNLLLGCSWLYINCRLWQVHIVCWQTVSHAAGQGRNPGQAPASPLHA